MRDFSSYSIISVTTTCRGISSCGILCRRITDVSFCMISRRKEYILLCFGKLKDKRFSTQLINQVSYFRIMFFFSDDDILIFRTEVRDILNWPQGFRY